MRRKGLVGLVAASAMAAHACGGGGDMDAAVPVDAADVVQRDTAPAPFRVRVAHFAAGRAAMDFCIAPEVEGTPGAFEGPLLATRATAAGLAYGEVTQYVPVPPSAIAYVVRAVAPGSADCATALAGFDDVTAAISGTPDNYATVALYGTAASPQAATLSDDRMSITGVMISRLRFVNTTAAASPALDLGQLDGGDFRVVFRNMARGRTQTGAEINSRGYAAMQPTDAATLGLRATGTTDVVVTAMGVPLRDGALQSSFAIGAVGDTANPLALVLCDDLVQVGALTRCEVHR